MPVPDMFRIGGGDVLPGHNGVTGNQSCTSMLQAWAWSIRYRKIESGRVVVVGGGWRQRIQVVRIAPAPDFYEESIAFRLLEF